MNLRPPTPFTLNFSREGRENSHNVGCGERSEPHQFLPVMHRTVRIAALTTPYGRRLRGATLIEMVAVILILGIASIAIMSQFSSMARSYASNERLQTGAQLAQECAEQILATRRLQSYAIARASPCPALPASYTTAGYTRTVSFNAAPAPTACVTAPCTRVDVVVNHASATPAEQARVVFMLGDY